MSRYSFQIGSLTYSPVFLHAVVIFPLQRPIPVFLIYANRIHDRSLADESVFVIAATFVGIGGKLLVLLPFLGSGPEGDKVL